MAHLNVHRFGSSSLARRAANLNPSVVSTARGVPVVNGINLNARDPHHGEGHGGSHGPALRKDFNIPKWGSRVETGSTGVARFVTPVNGECVAVLLRSGLVLSGSDRMATVDLRKNRESWASGGRRAVVKLEQCCQKFLANRLLARCSKDLQAFLLSSQPRPTQIKHVQQREKSVLTLFSYHCSQPYPCLPATPLLQLFPRPGAGRCSLRSSNTPCRQPGCTRL